jgi:hypothetical protein
MYLRYCDNSHWLGQNLPQRPLAFELRRWGHAAQARGFEKHSRTLASLSSAKRALPTMPSWILTAISSPYDDLSPHSGPVAECRKQAYISGSPSRARLAYSQEET